jgi:hypothetical protein
MQNADTPGTGRLMDTAEGQRLMQIRRGVGWRRWGPYLSERQWGTVREDYSPGGTAWDYLPHDHARSRAYRWGEDGLAGFGDERLRWCLGLALWNERDPILKERLFGLTNSQGNHGEDVKEHYAFLDGTPTHSYMRMVYKYPMQAFPYACLVEENARRGKHDPEFELYETGVFKDHAYFDVFVEYAKADTDDILMCVTVHNRSGDVANLHVIPQFWARNTWSWSHGQDRARIDRQKDGSLLAARHGMPDLRLEPDPLGDILFCENDTNTARLFGMQADGPFKDGINDYIVHGDQRAIRRDFGSKLGVHRKIPILPGASATTRLRLRPADSAVAAQNFDEVFARRRAEANEFYAVLQAPLQSDDERLVQRQALAGMLWCKQFYFFDVDIWLRGDPAQPPPPARRSRNSEWRHLNNADIVSMPDSWEYPWFAAWDLAFQSITFALIDPDFAKEQVLLLTRDWCIHPNGQLPAYEWAFGDVNPPVHAWAALRVYRADLELTGVADTIFLEKLFHKLLLNFTWWLNRKDAGGRNIFQGGFLGLDNVGVFDRSAPLPTGGSIDQSDGTAWMAMFALNMMRIAIELALTKPAYEDLASTFFEHFLAIAEAMTDMGGSGMGLWDAEDEFYYDVLSLPDGRKMPLRLRSIVGLIPIFAVEILEPDVFNRLPSFAARARWLLQNRPRMASLVSRWYEPGVGNRGLLSLLRGHRLKCLLRRALDTREFLSDFGVRSLSKAHAEPPYLLEIDGQGYEIGYEPGESERSLFGGNSNWRGPVWFPVNMLLVESLRVFHSYYGSDFTVEFPVGSGHHLSLADIADELAARLTRLFLVGKDGKRPFWGNDFFAAKDPFFRDQLMFHEHFHGDTGRGLGAAHQTGWTGLVANLIARIQAPNRASLPDTFNGSGETRY